MCDKKRYFTSIALNSETYKRLLTLCEKENRSRNNMIETIINRYDDKDKPNEQKSN